MWYNDGKGDDEMKVEVLGSKVRLRHGEFSTDVDVNGGDVAEKLCMTGEVLSQFESQWYALVDALFDHDGDGVEFVLRAVPSDGRYAATLWRNGREMWSMTFERLEDVLAQANKECDLEPLVRQPSYNDALAAGIKRVYKQTPFGWSLEGYEGMVEFVKDGVRWRAVGYPAYVGETDWGEGYIRFFRVEE